LLLQRSRNALQYSPRLTHLAGGGEEEEEEEEEEEGPLLPCPIICRGGSTSVDCSKVGKNVYTGRAWLFAEYKVLLRRLESRGGDRYEICRYKKVPTCALETFLLAGIVAREGGSRRRRR
jgi:hypothetical protein